MEMRVQQIKLDVYSAIVQPDRTYEAIEALVAYNWLLGPTT